MEQAAPADDQSETPLILLLVEDEFLIRVMLAEELRERGFLVVECETADQAWEYLASGGRVDIVFTDLHMPGQLSGLDLARRIAERFPHVRLLLTSGQPWRLDGSPFEFLAKPYGIDVLLTKLRRIGFGSRRRTEHG